jgi:hypothetical protein
MPLTIDVPGPLDEVLSLEAQRGGVPAAEHATLLLYLATALLSDDESTPFQEAVKEFLASRSLNADQVASVLEELVRLCAGALDNGAARAAPKATPTEDILLERLKSWRSAAVHHRPARDYARERISRDSVSTPSTSNASPQPPGKGGRQRPSAFGKYAGVLPSSEEFMREKEREIAREDGREA